MGRNARLRRQRQLTRASSHSYLDNRVAVKWAVRLEDGDAYSGIDNLVVGVVTKLATRLTRSDEICIIVYQGEYIGILWHRCKAPGNKPYSVGTIFLSDTWHSIFSHPHFHTQICAFEGFAFIFSKASAVSPLELWDKISEGVSSFYRIEPIIVFSVFKDCETSRRGVFAFQTDLSTVNRIQIGTCAYSDMTKAVMTWNEDSYSSELEASRATQFHRNSLAIGFTTFKGKRLDNCKPSDVYPGT